MHSKEYLSSFSLHELKLRRKTGSLWIANDDIEDERKYHLHWKYRWNAIFDTENIETNLFNIYENNFA